MPTSTPVPIPVDAPRRRPAWALPVVVVAVVAVVIAAVIGIRGLLGNPVGSVGPDGVATLRGTYQPVSCDSGCAQGYVQSGARSVFVRLPGGCAGPHADEQISVRARLDATLGKQAYQALDCPSH